MKGDDVRSMTLGIVVVSALLLVASLPAAAADLPDSPEGTVKAVTGALADGHPEILWEALPASYQRDITEITHAFAAKMDPEIWDSVFRLGQKTVVVLRDKKAYILDSSMMAAAADKKPQMEANWNAVVAVLDSVFTSDLSRLDSLKTIDWKKFLSTTGAQIMEKAAQISPPPGSDKAAQDYVAKLRATTVETVSRDGDTAVLRIWAPGEETEETSFTRVEGRWVPTEMATDWESKTTEAKQKIAAISPDQMAQGKPQVMGLLAMAEGVVDQLEAAESQEEFNQVLKNALGPFMGMAGGEQPPEETSSD